MLRRLRSAFLVLVAAALGAAAGRVALEARRRQEAGLDPLGLDIRRVTLRPQDLVPGIVAAFRMKDPPWSWLHIPAPLAALAVNFGVAAFGGDLAALRRTVERAAAGAMGFDPFEARHDESDWDATTVVEEIVVEEHDRPSDSRGDAFQG